MHIHTHTESCTDFYPQLKEETMFRVPRSSCNRQLKISTASTTATPGNQLIHWGLIRTKFLGRGSKSRESGRHTVDYASTGSGQSLWSLKFCILLQMQF